MANTRVRAQQRSGHQRAWAHAGETILGHVGDGNFHCFILFDPDDPKETRSARQANAALVTRALDMGGTCPGEHGIGNGKQVFLLAEHGMAVDTMRQVKDALDPSHRMNPGKIFSRHSWSA